MVRDSEGVWVAAVELQGMWGTRAAGAVPHQTQTRFRKGSGSQTPKK